MKHAIGNGGLVIAHVFLAMAHWQFTIGQTAFALESMQSTLASWHPQNDEWPLWVFGLVVFLIYSPIAWVRKLAYFQNGYIFAICMICVAVFTTIYYATKQI